MTYRIQSSSGKGNARLKRSRRGCEKRWNRYNEPFANLLKGEFPVNDKWLSRKPVPGYAEWGGHEVGMLDGNSL